jgi:molybdopterin/thiamine biosynthesis adenylyltransferase
MENLKPGMFDQDRLERSKRISWLDMDRIARTRCLVVGAGALGNEVIKDLVLSGFKRIELVDMDHVVRSNLNRCVFFREGDAENRSKKADIVACRASELDPSIEIIPSVAKIETYDLDRFRMFDMVFGCLDNIAARIHVNSHSYFANIPYIDGGTNGFRGKVQVVIPPETPCLQCAMNRSHYRVMEKRFSCTGSDVSYFEPKMPAEITTTSVVAAIQVREALKLASGRSDKCIRNILFYDGLNGTSDELEVDIDGDCPMHRVKI